MFKSANKINFNFQILRTAATAQHLKNNWQIDKIRLTKKNVVLLWYRVKALHLRN